MKLETLSFMTKAHLKPKLLQLFKSSRTKDSISDNHPQKKMMDAAESFHLLRVDDVMVPLADIIAIDINNSLHEVATAFKHAGHSRLPVYQDTLDNPSGMVHIKDLLPFLMFETEEHETPDYAKKQLIRQIQRPVLFVPPSMSAQSLLRRMQARRIHMAIVVDEYGGTDGLVTLEDLLEPIVGDIEDEHDGFEPEIRSLQDKTGHPVWEADARVMISDCEQALKRAITMGDAEDEVDTLGGLVFTLAGRVPERGEVIAHPDGLEFEILDADPRRVKRLQIRLNNTPASPSRQAN